MHTIPHRPRPQDLSVTEYAAARGVSVATVRRWIQSGHIDGRRVGPKLYRISGTELDT